VQKYLEKSQVIMPAALPHRGVQVATRKKLQTIRAKPLILQRMIAVQIHGFYRNIRYNPFSWQCMDARLV
jgi:hypothetical protein